MLRTIPHLYNISSWSASLLVVLLCVSLHGQRTLFGTCVVPGKKSRPFECMFSSKLLQLTVIMATGSTSAQIIDVVFRWARSQSNLVSEELGVHLHENSESQSRSVPYEMS